MAVLVTGAAGYIGAHMLLALEAAGEKAVAIDDLSTGDKSLCAPSVPFVEGNAGDQDLVRQVIEDHKITSIIHFAGSILIADSMREPLTYYRNNTANTINLIDTAIQCGIESFIFSSTAAVYGLPEHIPIDEATSVQSLTPYGASMSMSERILRDAATAHGLPHIILRYFNVAGADPDLRAGQLGKPSHLIRVAAQIAVGARKECLQIYGTDYPTPDGTAIRDYIHVTDLAEAHLAALSAIRSGAPSAILNCGYGRGYSVSEVVDAVERVTGEMIPIENVARRPGTPPN